MPENYRILVTGAAGFIGSHTAEYFAKAGHEVYGVDNFSDYYDIDLKKRNVKDIEAAGVTFLKADLTGGLQGRLSENMDYIFHYAAQPGISPDVSLKEYVQNNIFATQNLLDWAKQESSGLKLFVNIATSSIYGKEATLPETAPPEPISFYGTTKLAAEQLVLGRQRSDNLPACSLRLYSVYGPRERPEKLYTKLIKSIFDGTAFPLFKGSEKHSRSFTYVGDIIKGVSAVIGRENAVNGQIINIGSDKEYTTQEGIELIEKIIGKKAQIEVTPPRPGDQLRTTALIDKARKLLEYDPSTSFEEGLRKQVEWYRENFVG
ncbi:NAD-dependent epimerase/dehydratase family protein [Sinomicrobium weinanense]|uniref:NAD-dependent epimerase/dehydratase family protein n=1 Tax=Sinomicrobium weinanense TaxID=2842200 RepID=A0A926JRI0_9FLAO|nr:NAD-dependent epimerase/dehydratase family protein [Sinomicrobium weinanense]MBC9796039.1 NAD-dependent epimerase/dehydratase family protein [Sinomicrobium weinanense]MBU3123142.1 NAD-dependent epimerase/dehydratase family protein [Sinomicrobium weinanense]